MIIASYCVVMAFAPIIVSAYEHAAGTLRFRTGHDRADRALRLPEAVPRIPRYRIQQFPEAAGLPRENRMGFRAPDVSSGRRVRLSAWRRRLARRLLHVDAGLSARRPPLLRSHAPAHAN